jgi:hypothetical protein
MGNDDYSTTCLDLGLLGDLDLRLGDLDRCLLGGERLRRRSISFKVYYNKFILNLQI